MSARFSSVDAEGLESLSPAVEPRGRAGRRLVAAPLVVNFGGGVNSTAVLCGLQERSVRPDLILFADTGDEKPNTYEHLWKMQRWLEGVRFPPIVVLRRKIRRGLLKGSGVNTLEQECYANKTLPSRAFGFAGCSTKWKKQVIDGALKRAYRAHMAAGGRVRRALGIDWGELGRARFQPDGAFDWEYPLIDWRWSRAECVAAIERVGMSSPGKSACFYCPSTKKNEVIDLMLRHPDLYARAVAMERMAAPHLLRDTAVAWDRCDQCLDDGNDCESCAGVGRVPVRWEKRTAIKGLGRHWSWEQVGDEHRRQLPLAFDDSHCEAPCGCFDG